MSTHLFLFLLWIADTSQKMNVLFKNIIFILHGCWLKMPLNLKKPKRSPSSSPALCFLPWLHLSSFSPGCIDKWEQPLVNLITCFAVGLETDASFYEPCMRSCCHAEPVPFLADAGKENRC